MYESCHRNTAGGDRVRMWYTLIAFSHGIDQGLCELKNKTLQEISDRDESKNNPDFMETRCIGNTMYSRYV